MIYILDRCKHVVIRIDQDYVNLYKRPIHEIKHIAQKHSV